MKKSKVRNFYIHSVAKNVKKLERTQAFLIERITFIEQKKSLLN